MALIRLFSVALGLFGVLAVLYGLARGDLVTAAGGVSALFGAALLWALCEIHARLSPAEPVTERAPSSSVRVNSGDLNSDGRLLCPACGGSNDARTTRCEHCRIGFFSEARA